MVKPGEKWNKSNVKDEVDSKEKPLCTQEKKKQCCHVITYIRTKPLPLLLIQCMF